MVKNILIVTVIAVVFTACSASKRVIKNDGSIKAEERNVVINPKAKTFTKFVNIDRKAFVSYAKTFMGTPYKYGGVNPQTGLDCSGFIYIVFGHFNVKVPRSSVDFTNEGANIAVKDAKPGDLILFTGSDNTTGKVGHMAIVTANGKTTQFIHSSSGKNIGVIESKLEGYWLTHFVKVIRVLTL